MSTENIWPFVFEVNVLQWKAKRERTLTVRVEEDGVIHWLDHSGRFGHQGFGGFTVVDGEVRHFRGETFLTPGKAERKKQEFTIDVGAAPEDFQPIRELILRVGRPWNEGWGADQTKALHSMLERIYWAKVNHLVYQPFDEWDSQTPAGDQSSLPKVSSARALAERWQTFVECSKVHALVLVCRKCGSSFLDTGLPTTQLICRACGNCTHFDDERFAGLRVKLFDGLGASQSKSLLEKFSRDFGCMETSEQLGKQDKAEGHLHKDLLNALNTFLSRFSEVSSKLCLYSDARKEFCDAWGTAKSKIDAIAAEFKNIQ